MPAGLDTQQVAGIQRSNAREVTPLSIWGDDTLVYRSIIALAAGAVPLIALGNWLAHGTPWGSQLVVAAVLLAGAVICYALSRRGMQDTAAALLIGIIWLAATIFAFATEFGLHSSAIYLYLPCLLYTVLFFGVAIASIELALTLAALLLMYWAEQSGSIGGLRAFNEHSSNLVFLTGIVVTCIGTFTVGLVYHRRVASESARVVTEAGERRVAMEQAQLAQAQLETANARLQALNGELAAQARSHEQEIVRAKRDIDLYHDVISRDLPASLQALRAALAAPDHGTEARLQREIGHIAAVTGALDELGRSGEPPPRREPIDLSVLAREVAGQLRGRSRYARVRFDIGTSLHAQGDRKLVAALLGHLIKRAATACLAELEPVVQVGGGSLEGRAVFYVRDNGPGMDEAQREKMFRPFERAGTQEDTVDIGIVSARRIAERHGGELFVDSAPGKGSTFFFTLCPLPPQSPLSALSAPSAPSAPSAS
jgi:signal transduction histidine kinase